MSSRSTSDEIRQVEEALYGAVKHEFDARNAQLRGAGLRIALDPILRSGDRSNYTSYVEVTLRHADGDVHDVVFFYVAREGRLVVDAASMPKWITKTIDESLEGVEGRICLTQRVMSAMERLLDFCAALDRQKARDELSVARREAVMVSPRQEPRSGE